MREELLIAALPSCLPPRLKVIDFESHDHVKIYTLSLFLLMAGSKSLCYHLFQAHRMRLFSCRKR
jgi:hypothetical protein